MFPQTRLRRLRKTSKIRGLVEETHLSPAQMIWPVFVVPGKNIKEPIRSMPGQFHYSVDQLVKEFRSPSPLEPVLSEVERGEGCLSAGSVAGGEGLGGLLLFGVPSEKDAKATHAVQKNSLVAEAIQAIKDKFPNVFLMTDVCLCAYTDHGHCGLLNAKGEMQNDASLEVLAQMALRHVEAGADMVAPSDMLDGRIKMIRKTLDENGFQETPIMSYAAKYASAFYGPFRDAAHSTPVFGDRKSYQMNPANIREALREMRADAEEGADILMVKPAGSYLDVILAGRQEFDLPIAAFQVSGEYAMIKAAAQNGWLNEKEAMQESLLSIKRAGADIIISYFAPQFCP